MTDVNEKIHIARRLVELHGLQDDLDIAHQIDRENRRDYVQVAHEGEVLAEITHSTINGYDIAIAVALHWESLRRDILQALQRDNSFTPEKAWLRTPAYERLMVISNTDPSLIGCFDLETEERVVVPKIPGTAFKEGDIIWVTAETEWEQGDVIRLEHPRKMWVASGYSETYQDKANSLLKEE